LRLRQRALVALLHRASLHLGGTDAAGELCLGFRVQPDFRELAEQLALGFPGLCNEVGAPRQATRDLVLLAANVAECFLEGAKSLWAGKGHVTTGSECRRVRARGSWFRGTRPAS